jgi:hypothetical protein
MQIIKSVGVLSVAKITGAVYAVLGLFFMPFFFLFGLIASFAGRFSIQRVGKMVGRRRDPARVRSRYYTSAVQRVAATNPLL